MRILTLLSILLFLINGCGQVQPKVQHTYVKQELPTLKVYEPYPDYRVKYFPIDKVWVKAKKASVVKASKRAMQRKQYNIINASQSKSFNRLWGDQLASDIRESVNL